MQEETIQQQPLLQLHPQTQPKRKHKFVDANVKERRIEKEQQSAIDKEIREFKLNDNIPNKITNKII